MWMSRRGKARRYLLASFADELRAGASLHSNCSDYDREHGAAWFAPSQEEVRPTDGKICIDKLKHRMSRCTLLALPGGGRRKGFINRKINRHDLHEKCVSLNGL